MKSRVKSRLPQLIGVIHLPPLAGSPGSAGEEPSFNLQKAGLLAVREARILEQAGFDGIILENFGDLPFYKDRVPPETIASLSVLAAVVRESTRLSLGINVLRNDGRAALAIAAVTGCDFIRVNVLSGVAATDQGMVEGDAAFLLRERIRLGAEVEILADVHVKHAKTISSDNLHLAAEDSYFRSLADGIVVSGATTGRPVDLGALESLLKVSKTQKIPIFVGSGATRETAGELRRLGARVIVSSALRQGGRAGAPLDLKRAREFAKLFRKGKARARK